MPTRRAQLAGRWYPGSEGACRRDIEQLIEQDTPSQVGIAGVVPHAGWMFSGAVAVKVFQALAAATPKPELLLLFGTHQSPHDRPHLSRASAFETPLGPIEADEELAATLAEELGLPQDPADTARGGADNTVEVQLPLIKYFLPEVRLVVVSPPYSTEAIGLGQAAAAAAKKRGVAIAAVGSTDLTHYGPNYGFSPQGSGEKAVRWVKEENDARLIEQILKLDPEGVIGEAMRHHNACVPGAVAAALAAGRELGARQATLLDYRTSYDIHPNHSFVGYAGVVLH